MCTLEIKKTTFLEISIVLKLVSKIKYNLQKISKKYLIIHVNYLDSHKL